MIINNTHSYRAIVFDLDGTLLDSWPSLLSTVCRMAPANACAIEPSALRLKLSEGIAPMFQLALEQMGLAPAAADTTWEEMEQHYRRHSLLHTRPYGAVGGMLAQLASAGVRLALCTNRDRSSTQALLALMGWGRYFNHVQCWGDGLAAKPDPEPLLATLACLACPAQDALFVGDSGVDATCAAQAGVDFAAHLGGYHASPEELQVAILRYEQTEQLLQWLQGRLLGGEMK